MQAVSGTGTVVHSVRTVGGSVASHVTGAQQVPSHMFPQRSADPCTCSRHASEAAAMTARWTLAARNAARYSEV